jgi:hypothetical protein
MKQITWDGRRPCAHNIMLHPRVHCTPTIPITVLRRGGRERYLQRSMKPRNKQMQQIVDVDVCSIGEQKPELCAQMIEVKVSDGYADVKNVISSLVECVET